MVSVYNESMADERHRREVVREATYPVLIQKFPNLNKNALFAEGGGYISGENAFRKIEDLVALAEIFGFTDRVWTFDIHGQLPVMYIDLGPKVPEEPDSGRVVKKIYSKSGSYNNQPYLSIWGENWDPSVLNKEMQVTHDGSGEYHIVLK